jgi:quinol monooxygenase YgiN
MIASSLRLLLSETDFRKVISSLTPLIGWTRVQPGCRACRLLTDTEDPRALVLWEEWDTQDDLDRHLRSREYQRVLAAIDLSQDAPEIHFDAVETRGGFEVVEAVRLPPTQ